MDNNIIKFKDFTNEATYKVDDSGNIKKQEWELYKDWHPLKFKVSNLTKKEDVELYNDNDYVWVIKNNDNIVATLSSMMDEKKVNDFFNSLKNNDIESKFDNNVNEKDVSDM